MKASKRYLVCSRCSATSARQAQATSHICNGRLSPLMLAGPAPFRSNVRCNLTANRVTLLTPCPSILRLYDLLHEKKARARPLVVPQVLAAVPKRTPPRHHVSCKRPVSAHLKFDFIRL